MSKNDPRQRKKKERQERLRKEKHLRHYGTRLPDELIPPDWERTAGAEDDEPELVLPPATATERMIRKMQQGPSLLRKLRTLLPGGQRSDNQREQAQELAYDALEEPNPRRAAELARRALALDPDCTDALYTLALNTASSRAEQIKLMEQAVKAGERTLGGPHYFEENRGHFWGLLETRPYMRARAALADLLRDREHMPQAIGHYEALLDLNPNDNQGMRDVLIGCYFQVGDLESVRRLLQQYDGDSSAIFAYARVLERFQAGDMNGATGARREAQRNNPHVEGYLTGRKRPPRRLPDYYSPGDESEAIHCAVYLSDAWQQDPNAVSWLKSNYGP